MAINFNTEPYYDDFSEDKKYYRILYRPGYAVQARELTQMQTILQNQVSRFGDHVFKEGAMVIPGQISIDTKVGYVKLEASYSSILASTVMPNLVGKTITSSSGIQAEVIHYIVSEGSDPATIFVRYKDSGTNNITKTFADGAVIEDVDQNYEVQAISSDATGTASLCDIQRGVYFTKGHFVLCEEQKIILEKYSGTPSYRIGLVAKEEIKTADDDESLFDNAQNSFNYAAPGAHRYYIDLTLTKLALDSEDDADFIELIRVGEGTVAKKVNSTQYAEMEKEFARRTYDESGNYTVLPFDIDVREYRDNNRGAYASSRVYLRGDVVTNSGNTYIARNEGSSVGSTPPTHTTGLVYDGAGNTGIQWEYTDDPYYNRGVNSPAAGESLATAQANEAKLSIGLEPGKAYVQGYEIEKLATEYVTVDKARDTVDVSQAVVSSQMGNYVLVKNLYNFPDIDTFSQINLYDRAVTTDGSAPASGVIVGTARARHLEYHSGTKGTDSCVYKLFLFDIQMGSGYSFSEDVKAFHNSSESFSADIEPVETRLVGSVTSSGTTVTGYGTEFSLFLEAGDYVLIGSDYRRVTVVNNDTTLTIGSALTQASQVTIGKVTTEVKEPEKSNLIFPLPNYAIEDITSTTYVATEVIDAQIDVDEISVDVSQGSAEDVDADAYLVLNADTGAVIDVDESDISVNGANVTFSNLTDGDGTNVKVIVTAAKSNSNSYSRKSKTLQSNATVSFTTQSSAQESVISLGKADGYRLVSVMMDVNGFGGTPSYTKDITDRYEFDDGQRGTHYDLARIVLKNSYAPPSGNIQVTFDYFTHSTGDYCTKNSYGSIDYKGIPFYGNTPLRDVYDFRPRMNDNGTFPSGNGNMPPKRGASIRSDYSYYLARKSKIAVDFNGNFFNIDGEPSLNPGEPLDPALGMVLYSLTLEPYTFGTGSSSITVDKKDNRRYTMRDIGKIEKRVDNLEYYTALNMLEQQTESLDVLDADGNSRFKNGFVVDNFTGHSTGDSADPDYLCAIDMKQAELRPFFSMQNANIIEKNSNDTDRGTSNYKLYGDVITLPVTDHVPLIEQNYASRLENINPFAVFTFIGDVKLNPSTDEWFEVDRRPDLVINLEGNFNTIKNALEKSGVLGTVWGSWQDMWVGEARTKESLLTGRYDAAWGANLDAGKQISIDEINARFGNKKGAGWARREVTIETSATDIGQSRTGIKTSVVAKVDRKVVGDKVLSTAAIPYIRSRNILVQIKKLKPNTRFYPFFDNVDISSYCTPASKMIYVPAGATDTAKYNTHSLFDVDTNVGGLATETERRIGGDSQVCLNKGDVITGATSGATAVVVGKEWNDEDDQYILFLQNINGTFTTSETITGSVSGKTGSVTSVDVKSQGDSIITNGAGDAQLLFNIPNTEAVRFRCGTRELKLIDVNDANGDFTSRGRANYIAAGTLETRQQTVHAVRNAQIVEEQVTDNRVIVKTSERVVNDTGWYDPLAQTFLIDSEGGAFLSKVDIYFASKDPKIPVTFEIREVINGYPGRKVLPFSRVTLKPEEVNISDNTVVLDDANVASYDTPTTFEFPSPVYVQNNTEYCFVLASDSNNYRVWISQIGDQVPGTSRTISEQPYLGSLFKSQNASTWTADQTQDIKFKIYKCAFDTSVTGSVDFVNDVLLSKTLERDPFEMKSGSSKIRVWHRNHGLTVDTSETSRVLISGVVGDNSDESELNGIPITQINTSHLISDVDLDSYVITVTATADNDGYYGDFSVKAVGNIQYDTIHPMIQAQTFPETQTTLSLTGISGRSVDPSSSAPLAYVPDSAPIGIVPNENNYFTNPKMVASETNETAILSGDKSLQLTVSMSSTNANVSPIIDTHRTSAILISNKVNNPIETETNVDGLDENTIISSNTNITVSGSQMTTSDSATQLLFKAFTVGKYATVDDGTNEETSLITAIASDGSSITFADDISSVSGGTITVTQRELFVAENAANNSSTYSKYVTKKINLANPSNYLRLKFAGNIPDDADVEIWYRVLAVGSTETLSDLPYTQMSSDSTIQKADNWTEQFYEMSYSEDNIKSFDAFQVKIVMKSANSSAVPRIKDLRIIACA